MSALEHFGATPEEWLQLELMLGAACLLPVVSNPQAIASERSSLRGTKLVKRRAKVTPDRRAKLTPPGAGVCSRPAA